MVFLAHILNIFSKSWAMMGSTRCLWDSRVRKLGRCVRLHIVLGPVSGCISYFVSANLFQASEPILFEGRTDGTIVSARGAAKFGWDPVFEPNGTGLTCVRSAFFISFHLKTLEQICRNGFRTEKPHFTSVQSTREAQSVYSVVVRSLYHNRWSMWPPKLTGVPIEFYKIERIGCDIKPRLLSATGGTNIPWWYPRVTLAEKITTTSHPEF